MTKPRGFSLLEVMVAVAILGLTLTVILSAQGGLAASNRSAANMGQATQLGRCKMTEVQENLLRLGYQETDQIDLAQPCCIDGTPDGFTCDIKIEKIELPNITPSSSPTGSGAAPSIDGGVAGILNAAGAGTIINNAAGGPGLNLNIEGGTGDIAGQVGNMLNGGAGGAGTEGLLNMVMSFLYPSLKPMYEMAIRRITVTVHWKEGPNVRDLPLTQFVTDPARAGFAANALMADGGTMDFSGDTTGAGKSGTSGGTSGSSGSGGRPGGSGSSGSGGGTR